MTDLHLRHSGAPAPAHRPEGRGRARMPHGTFRYCAPGVHFATLTSSIPRERLRSGMPKTGVTEGRAWEGGAECGVTGELFLTLTRGAGMRVRLTRVWLKARVMSGGVCLTPVQ